MLELYSNCRFCEVGAICKMTEEACEAYHQYFGWEQDDQGSSSKLNAVNSGKGKPDNHGNDGCWINRLTGQVVKIGKGEITAQITIDIGGNYITSIMPLEKLTAMGTKVGDTISVAIKAHNISIMR